MSETLQFPLPLLAYGKTHFERCDAAITYACIKTGQHRLKELSASEIASELAGVSIPRPEKKITVEQVNALVLGDKYCGVNRSGPVAGAYHLFYKVDSFLTDWKAKGLTVPWARVPRNMVFEARDGNAANYQRFAALCAVNSVIGQKPFCIVTIPRVRAGMLGYSSGKLLFDKTGNLHEPGQALLRERADPTPTISTRSQARTLLTNLVKSGLYHRYQPYTGSVTYYSKTLTAESVAEALLRKASRTVASPKAIELGERIKAARLGKPLLCGDENETSPHNTESPHNRETTTPSSPDHHPVTTPSPHNASLNVSLSVAQNASLFAGYIAPPSEVKSESGEALKPIDYSTAKSRFRSMLEAEGVKP